MSESTIATRGSVNTNESPKKRADTKSGVQVVVIESLPSLPSIPPVQVQSANLKPLLKFTKAINRPQSSPEMLAIEYLKLYSKKY